MLLIDNCLLERQRGVGVGWRGGQSERREGRARGGVMCTRGRNGWVEVGDGGGKEGDKRKRGLDRFQKIARD